VKKLALVMLVSGCATVPMARQETAERARNQKPLAGTASVYLYRPGSFTAVKVLYAATLDEQSLGNLAPKTFAVQAVPPGEHRLVVDGLKSRVERIFVVEAGRTYFFRTQPRVAVSGDELEVELVTSEAQAREQLADCGLIADPAAEALRAIAQGIADHTVDPVEPQALLEKAVRAFDVAAGPVGLGGAAPPPSQGLEEAIARLRMRNPRLGPEMIVSGGAAAMAASLQRQRPEAGARVMDEGTGLVLRRVGPAAVVAATLPDSPAAAAGIETGLELREVEGRPTREHAPIEVVRLMAGQPGGEVNLTLGEPGGFDRKVSLRRATPRVGVVDCRVLRGDVLYVRPWDLSTSSARKVRDLARGGPATAVILDLRDNPGGEVDGARDLADSFLAAGRLFAISGARIAELNKAFKAAAGTSSLEQARLVVLVNGNTAGGAEAVAAAVQDNRRGGVIGSHTAGVGTVVNRLRIQGVWVAIPTARILRANGGALDVLGVTPDTSAMPAPAAESLTDVACPGVVSPSRVADDVLVTRAVHLLAAAAR